MVTIYPIQTHHYLDYVDLIDSQLGKGYLTERDFSALANDLQAVCFEAQNAKGEVLGVITGKILPKQDVFPLLKILPE